MAHPGADRQGRAGPDGRASPEMRPCLVTDWGRNPPSGTQSLGQTHPDPGKVAQGDESFPERHEVALTLWKKVPAMAAGSLPSARTATATSPCQPTNHDRPFSGAEVIP